MVEEKKKIERKFELPNGVKKKKGKKKLRGAAKGEERKLRELAARKEENGGGSFRREMGESGRESLKDETNGKWDPEEKGEKVRRTGKILEILLSYPT